MRVWVIFLLLFCFISFVTAVTERKDKKDASTGTDPLPEIGDGDSKELPADSEEAPEEPARKETKKGQLPNSKRYKDVKDKSSKDDNADSEEVASRIEEVKNNLCKFLDDACAQIEDAPKKIKDNKKDAQGSGNSKKLIKVCIDGNNYCTCAGDNRLDCSRKKNDRSKLYSAYIVPNRKGDFKVMSADFSDQEIVELEKDKILPGREDEVEELIFSGNMIEKIDKGAFFDFKHLVKLYLDSNEIAKISADQFEDLGGLHKLHLTDNKITSLPNGVFKSLKNLKQLVLDGNALGDSLKKETFEGLTNLEELSLDRCKINVTLPSNVFDHLINLKKLSLRENPFTEVPAAIKELDQLEELDISKTQIVEIHENSFAKDMKLKYLYIRQMPYLYKIQDKAFCGMDNLEELYLNNNTAFAELHENAFGMATLSEYKVAQLKVLDISNCNLTVISEDLLFFEDIETMSIGGNPWNCTCETAFLLGQRIYEFDFALPPPKCTYPAEHTGKVFARVQGVDVCPKLKEKKAVWRGIKGLSAILLLTVTAVGCMILYNRGFFRSFMVRKNGTPTFPSMTYSNLNNTDDGRSLEADFQPRPEEV